MIVNFGTQMRKDVSLFFLATDGVKGAKMARNELKPSVHTIYGTIGDMIQVISSRIFSFSIILTFRATNGVKGQQWPR